MFEGIFENKNVINLIKNDIKNNYIPNSILIAGEKKTQKLEIALEIARSVSCKDGAKKDCICRSCLNIKALNSNYILINGNKENVLNFQAFLKNYTKNKNKETAFLLEREIKKIIKKFEFYKKKGSTEILEKIYEQHLPNLRQLKLKNSGIINEITKLVAMLPQQNALNVETLRNILNYAKTADQSQNKFIILEHIESLNESSLNLLLKTLEEPPENTYFILSTLNKNKIIKTILSRVRVYNTFKLKKETQKKIIEEIFLSDEKDFDEFFKRKEDSIIKNESKKFFNLIYKGEQIQQKFVLEKQDMNLFIKHLYKELEKIIKSDFDIINLDKIVFIKNIIQSEYNNFLVYNISTKSFLENIILEAKSFYN